MWFIRAFILFPLLLLGGYFFWSNAGRTAAPLWVDLILQEVREIGKNTGKGNVVAIQPYLVPMDYATEANFFLKLDGYFQEAQRNRFLDTGTVVVLPEHIGTWLVTANEKKGIYFSSNVKNAMSALVFSNLFSYFMTEAPESVADKETYTVFNFKSSEMAKMYQNVFSSLAKKYKVHIIAGSIVLMEPYFNGDSLKTSGGGFLYNTSLVFQPNGKPIQKLVKKCYPIQTEKTFMQSASVNELPVFDLPIGKTGVLICADSWYPEAYLALKGQGVEFLAVPSFITGDGTLKSKWQGYNGANTYPSDVNQAHIANISEEEAWMNYALPKRAADVQIDRGINVFLRGKLWDMGSDGYTMVLNKGKLETGKQVEGASILCVWMNEEEEKK